jgi:hypothetical protein
MKAYIRGRNGKKEKVAHKAYSWEFQLPVLLIASRISEKADEQPCISALFVIDDFDVHKSICLGSIL